MFFKGIFFVCVFGGEFDPSVSDGDDLLVDRKLRFYKQLTLKHIGSDRD